MDKTNIYHCISLCWPDNFFHGFFGVATAFTSLRHHFTSYTWVCFELHAFKVIDNLSQVSDFYWSIINDVWHVGGSAMVGGLLLKGSWFSSRRFFCPSPRPPPLARFVNPQPGPELATWIQDGDLIMNSVFFDHPNRLRAGYFIMISITL